MEIKAHFREGRKKPWEARWYVKRRARTRFFATEKERDKFIKDFNREISKRGNEVLKIDVKLQREWLEVEEILPGVSPLELAEYWVLTRGKVEEYKFLDAMQAYLLEMKRAGRDLEYQKHTLRALTRFSSHFGDWQVKDISSKEISDFIHGLPFQPLTKGHYRTYLVTAFKWFSKQGWIQNNPVEAVPVPKVHVPEPGILSLEEAEALFRENEYIDPEICGLLALGAFAGMRTSAICRVAWEELDFKNQTILTPASKTKKGRRHFIEGLPDNLWLWLERTPREAFQMGLRQFSYRRENAFSRAGLLVTKAAAKSSKGKIEAKAPPKNCLRHSFVSYHVALHRDPGKTALLVSHKDQGILWDHYLGVATMQDGCNYFKITPD